MRKRHFVLHSPNERSYKLLGNGSLQSTERKTCGLARDQYRKSEPGFNYRLVCLQASKSAKGMLAACTFYLQK